MEKQDFDHDGNNFGGKSNQNEDCENAITHLIQNLTCADLFKMLSIIINYKADCRSWEGGCQACMKIMSMFK